MDVEQCLPQPHTVFDTSLGVFLCIGTLFSYLPQVIKIIHRRSSEGFSPYFVLLGSVGAFSNVNNIILLQLHGIMCCRVWEAEECLFHTVGIMQICVQWFMFFSVFVLYVVYFPQHLRYQPTSTSLDTGKPTSEWQAAQAVRSAVLYHMGLVSVFSFILVVGVGPNAWQVHSWASFLGIFSMLVTCVQFFPQIHKTWTSRQVGSLSIPMMLMQTPGGYLFAYSIYVRPGVNWTSWITYFAAATLQGILLFISVVWHFREKRLRQQDEQSEVHGNAPVVTNDDSITQQTVQPASAEEETHHPDETTSLLPVSGPR
ncbi:hypothetical protein IWQ62_001870 [Dispira parvispora]|uniref:PQ loop repeat protein n=1 Tax=Dispira parvispora TaxID=1520584 RepID=A0A9W8AV37_9FUNG|nr:hypothetical protein IWQ62_001870 [Dispira parvispora]